jgi:CSLREA domain-containing protein
MFTPRWIRRLFARTTHTIRKAPTRRRCRPALEILEDRVVPSVYKVTGTGDDTGTVTTTGHVGTQGDPYLASTLRAAVTAANGNNQANTIVFDPTVFATQQTITLGGSELTLTNTAGTQTITGPAAGVKVDAAQNSRVLEVQANVTASLSGVTLSRGKVTGDKGGDVLNAGNLTLTSCSITGGTADFGGGLYNSGTATLSGCTVSDNHVDNTHHTARGGGIDSQSGTLTITNGSISNNSATNEGGGILVDLGMLTITNCTVSNNAGGNYGGGVATIGTTTPTPFTMRDCTISGNSAIAGGGLLLTGTVNLLNCTISGNHAFAYGGGIDNIAILAMVNCTVYDNSAYLAVTTGGQTTVVPGSGGGIYNTGANAVLTNCTVANNEATNTVLRINAASNASPIEITCPGAGQVLKTGDQVEITGVTGNTAANGVFTVTRIDNDHFSLNQSHGNGAFTGGGTWSKVSGGNIFNKDANGRCTLNNSLIAYGANGGDIAGLVSGNNNLVDDQLTAGGLTTANHNIFPTIPDIAHPGYSGGPTVTIPLNSLSPAVGAGDPSLIPSGTTTDQRGAPRTRAGTVDIGAFERGPITIVVTTLTDEDNGSPDPALGTGTSLREAINFANLDPGGGDTITFAPGLHGTLNLTRGVLPTITGHVTIIGPSAKVLSISALGVEHDLSIAAGAQVFIAGLTLTGAHGGSGGAVANAGALNLTACTLTGNQATNGGGVDNTGTLDLIDCTLSANHAFASGGGVFNGGALTMINCTLSGNSADFQGSGLYGAASATTTVINCTIAGNSGQGGGISAQNVTLNNTIVANNGDGGDIRARVSGHNNLVDDAASAGAFGGVLTDGVGGNVVGVPAKLGPLADNGGPTQTMALLPGSPALFGGNNALVPSGITTDQRGAQRIKGAAVDIGAFDAGPSIITVTSLADSNAAGTLRSAINYVNDIDPQGGVGIVFAAGLQGTLDLTQGMLPAINGDLAIVGPGANLLTIDAQGKSSILSIASGGVVALSGLTLSNGSAISGGAIANAGTLVLTDCTLSGNTATGRFNGNGGAISSTGSLYLGGCTLSADTATQNGGALYSKGYLGLTDCTISGNSASQGGGIDNYPSATLTLVDCTVSGNSATTAGGIYGHVTLDNTIVAHSGSGGDFLGVASGSNNLIDDANSAGGLRNGVAGNLVGVDPKLGALANDGGSTQTMSLLSGSPAIGAGDIQLVPLGLDTDQRGVSRFTGTSVDIGAFESGPKTITVTTLVDEDNGSVDPLQGAGTSLREAINFANADPAGGDTIVFSPLMKGALDLSLGALPTITTSLTIQGPGANVVTISGQGKSRILALAASANVTVSGLTLSDGSAAVGGGILNTAGTLKLVACTLSGNTATSGSGGGIYNTGSLTLSNSTLSGNHASTAGGGVYNNGKLTLTDCTVQGNTATKRGGGIYSYPTATLSLAHCTVAGNSANSGGGLFGKMTLNNTNVATSGSAGDIFGSATGSNNLIDDATSGGGLANGVGGNLLGADPKLGPLVYNGGSTPTMALLPGSKAIAAGSAAGVTTDQRGLPLDAPTADIGAFQYQGPPPTVKITLTDPTPPTAQVELTFTLQATDPTSADQKGTFTYTIDWNDGNVQTIQGPATKTVTHAYQSANSYTPHVVAIDQDFRSSAPAVLAAPVVVSALTSSTLTTVVTVTNTVSFSVSNLSEESIALALVNQASQSSWMGSTANIQVASAVPVTDIVIDPTSPSAQVNVIPPLEFGFAALIPASNPYNTDKTTQILQMIEFAGTLAALSVIGGEGAGEAEAESVDGIVTEAIAFANKQGLKGVGVKVEQLAAARANTLIGSSLLTAAATGTTVEDNTYALVGASPALVVEQGTVSLSGALASTTTDSSTLIVRGGTLSLGHNLIAGNFDGSQPLIEVDGGTLIVGAPVGTHANTLGAYGSAVFVHVAGTGKVIVQPGNTFDQIQLSDTSIAAQAAGATSVQLASSAPTATPGQKVTFTATVTAAGAPATVGSVEFFDNTTGAFLGMVPVNHGSAAVQATLDPTTGDTIYATYLPTTNALAPSSGHLTQIVAYTTTTRLTGPASNPTYGQSVTFTATVASSSGGVPTGSVEFYDGSTDLGHGTTLSGSGTNATSTFTTTKLTAVPHTLQAVYTPSGTFQQSSDSLKLTVNPAVLTITPDAHQSKLYGAAVPPLTYTASGFVNGDGRSLLTGVPGTTAMSSSPVGTYQFTLGTLTAAGGNYTLALAASAPTFAVSPATLKVTASDVTRIYGVANPTFSDTITGLVNGDDSSVVHGSPTLSTTATASSAPNTYPITAGLGSLAATNYTFNLVNGKLTINPATLTVTAGDATRNYGVANPTFSDTITGFVNGDDASVVHGSPTLSTTATPSSAPNSYPITAGLGSLAATNYTFSPVNGTLTVNPARLSASGVNVSVPVGAPFSGPVATFTNADPFGSPSSYSATVSWGDGDSSDGTISDSGGGTFTVSGSHIYTSPGSDTFNVHITHNQGFTTPATAQGSATVSSDAVLNGTDGDDSLVLMPTARGKPGDITYVFNGAAPVALHGVTSFTIHGGPGNDTVTVSLANGGPLVKDGAVRFDGGSGMNTLNLDAAGLPVRITPGSFNAGGQVVSFNNISATHVNNAAVVNAFAGPDTADRATALGGLDAQERFVQALYLDDLGRAGTKTEVDDWVNGQLNQPGGSQQAVAAAIAGSPEADDHLVQSWYFAFLGRQAASSEVVGWVKLLQAGQSEEQVLRQILGDPGHEFYDRAQTLGFGGTADQNYVQGLYQGLLNRRASSSELDNGVAALQTMGRQGLALALLDSEEFRGDQFAGYFATLLHRPADGSLANWVASGLDAHGVRVAFESGMEFYSNC